MQKFIIQGGQRLEGEIIVQGAKNSALPILAAALLCEGESVLENCPELSDVYAACRILTSAGCQCSMQNHTVHICADSPSCSEVPEQLMQEMRSSIIFLGAMLGRTGVCTLGYPGGCELGLPMPQENPKSQIWQSISSRAVRKSAVPGAVLSESKA